MRDSISPARRLQVLGPALTLVSLMSASCVPKAGQAEPQGEMTRARLAASETKVAQLEERLSILEAKTGRLDGVAEGVAALLEKLDQVRAESANTKRAAKPSPTATYSVPIDEDPYIGPKYAKVTMVKGFDFYCSYCDKVRPVLKDLRTLYGDDLKIVFKNFVIHEDYARLPALAACAAHRQSKFMPMYEKIWVQGVRARQELTEPKLIAIAKSLKLKQKRFLRDMHGTCEDKVRKDFEILSAVGASGTPAFYINGRFIAGALPVGSFRRIIDQELEKANRALQSGVLLKNYYQTLVRTGRTSL